MSDRTATASPILPARLLPGVTESDLQTRGTPGETAAGARTIRGRALHHR